MQTEIAKRRDNKTPFPLHKWVHLGSSNQAMLFNLFGPLIARDDLEPLKLAVKKVGIKWPDGENSAKFEYEDRAIFNEQQVQPTSIDLVFGDPDKEGALFIEAKLVESGPGGCSLFADSDCNEDNSAETFNKCYLHHVGRTYWVALQKHGLSKGTSPVTVIVLWRISTSSTVRFLLH